jgi:hypothetical protein
MSTNQLVTKKLKVEAAQSFVRSVQQNFPYYVFAAKHTPYEIDNAIPMPLDNTKTQIEVYDDMIFGKKIKYNDVTNMARRYDWSLGTVYDMYHDNDTDLASKQFYVSVNAGTETYVYKCLFNNNRAASIVEPSGTDIDPFETPSDGYIWKYMYTIDDFTMRKFSTTEYLPVIIDTNVQTGAINGSIDVIEIADSGLGYDNYLIGEFNSINDIRIGENSLLYALSGSASSIDNFYNGCLIKMTSGAAINEYKVITDYYISAGQKIIVLENSFTNRILPTDTYEIYPNVFIYDTSGTSTEVCIARAIIDSTSGNTISKIEILNGGAGYRSATAILQTDVSVDIDIEAQLNVIISPEGGHGSNVVNELFSRYVGINAYFIGNETPLSDKNDFRTIGILKDPLFANVTVNIDTSKTVGSFLVGEPVLRYKPIKLTGSVNITSNSYVTGTDVNFTDALRNNDKIIINTGAVNILATVNQIIANNAMTVITTSTTIGSNCSLTLIESDSYGTVLSFSANKLNLTNVATRNLSLGTSILGQESFATTSVNAIAIPTVLISGRDANEFGGFNQLTKFVGTLSSGTFIDDETIQQDSVSIYTQPQAKYHSLIDSIGGLNDEMYVTNVKNTFLTTQGGSDGTVLGASSNAYFIISDKYNGDLVRGSGEILYLENLSPIARNFRQTETIKLILEF